MKQRIPRFNDFVNESFNVPSSFMKVRGYLDSILVGVTSFDEVVKILNETRSRWNENDFDNAWTSGACETWNTEIALVLDSKKIRSSTYYGEADDLPDHYITIANDLVFDFVVAQFWGYGLGNGIKNADRVTFTMKEYKDIYDSYKWKKIK